MDINLEQLRQNANNGESNSASLEVKVPKRVLHFSDGTMEEYSEDEVDDTPTVENPSEVIDPKKLTWGPWMRYKMWAAGSTTLSACDYVGESLASVLGITTPKYHFEIEEYKRREEEKKKDEEERKGWSYNTSSQLVTKERVEGPTPV